MVADADYLQTAYDAVAATYGDVDGYLRDGLGLSDETLRAPAGEDSGMTVERPAFAWRPVATAGYGFGRHVDRGVALHLLEHQLDASTPAKASMLPLAASQKNCSLFEALNVTSSGPARRGHQPGRRRSATTREEVGAHGEGAERLEPESTRST